MGVAMVSGGNRGSRRGYMAAKDYKFTVHYQVGERKGRHYEFWLRPSSLEDSEGDLAKYLRSRSTSIAHGDHITKEHNEVELRRE